MLTRRRRLIGSAEAGSLLKPPERYYTSESIEHMFFTFSVRTASNVSYLKLKDAADRTRVYG